MMWVLVLKGMMMSLIETVRPKAKKRMASDRAAGLNGPSKTLACVEKNTVP